MIGRLIDWCLTPTLAVFQLYRGMIGRSNYYKLYNVYKSNYYKYYNVYKSNYYKLYNVYKSNYYKLYNVYKRKFHHHLKT